MDADGFREQILRLERASRALDPGSGRRRRLRNAIVASSERFLRRIDTIGAWVETDDRGERLLETPISEHGIGIEQAIELIERDVVRPEAQPASPGYLAFIPGGGLYHSALGDYLAAVTNKYAGVFFAGPGAVRMENMLLRWSADLVGYPSTAGGNIASGGSIANLAAIVAARDTHGLRAAEYAKAVVYLTSQAHHSLEKALHIAGMREAIVRRVAMDDRYRMRTDALDDAIRADRAQGLRPWLVVAAAGATDTGAVDPLDDIATIAKRENCWYHVDAAYGGYFLLTEHGRRILRGIERSDSVTLDPHKGLFLPYGSGIVLARDVNTLRAAHRYSAQYLQDVDTGDAVPADEVSPADVSPELTKHFRGLRMWLPLVLVGTRPFAAALEEKLLLARYFHEAVRNIGFETGPEPDLSISTFRRVPDGADLDVANRLNHAIIDGVRRDGRVALSSTMLDGRYTLRLAVLAFRTHLRTIDMTLRVLREQRNRLATS